MPKQMGALELAEAMQKHITKELTDHVFPLPQDMTEVAYAETMKAFSEALCRAFAAGVTLMEGR